MSNMLMIPQPLTFRIIRVIAHFKKPLIILCLQLSWTNVHGILTKTYKTKEMVIFFDKQWCLDDVPPVHNSVLIAGTLKES